MAIDVGVPHFGSDYEHHRQQHCIPSPKYCWFFEVFALTVINVLPNTNHCYVILVPFVGALPMLLLSVLRSTRLLFAETLVALLELAVH